MDAALSDLVRFIVLRKYGGIYTDLDNIFIKEMSPLCGSSFVYYWSDAQSPSDSNVALANTAVMGCALGCDFVEH
jgi:mannosyltransferase OCH1-like enzyme